MMIVLVVFGFGVAVAGLVAIGFGIPAKEFSLGSTLIIAGTIGFCTGLIVLGITVVVSELRNISQRLGSADQARRGKRELYADPESSEEPAPEGPLFMRDQPRENVGAAEPAPAALPWQKEIGRERARQRGTTPPAAEMEPEPKLRRSLSLSSPSRRDRDRAGSRVTDPFADDLNSTMAAQPTTPVPSPDAGPSAGFEDTWPPQELPRSDPYRRSARRPSVFNDANAGAPLTNDRSQVTILKSGVVDGMAYSLYSDGSIEAQMPEGMMRFASIGELRAHLDQRL